ncbi:HpcH/HpaI aldolase family protein [Pseudooceanicola sp. C21-150M6]|uniref:HpcH/HpaI aldolase family protein n=1 Tax=Pseudooceanicola sp. C21-150M6 TaxID=3434355 RepID=UPI003D7F7667
MTSLRRRIAEKRPMRGPFLSIPSVVAAEIVAGARPDFLCIDTEHSPIDDALVADMIRVADLAGLPALVRVRANLGQNIAAALDAGAAGVLVPHVSTAEEAEAAVRHARFPPEGARGAGPGRAAGYLRDIPGHVARARQDTVVMVQIETLKAVENLDAILAVAGIDLVFIGPGDLSIDLAARGGADSTDRVIDQILDAADRARRPVGIFSADRGTSARWLRRLAFVIEGSDAMVLSQGTDLAFAPLSPEDG